MSLHGGLSIFYLQYSFLSSVKVSIFFSQAGIEFQMIGLEYFNEFLLQHSVLTEGYQGHIEISNYKSSWNF